MELKDSPTVLFSPSLSRDLQNGSSTNCSRCRGCLVATFCVSPDEGIADFQISVWRCMQCGDLFDQTILENRRRSKTYQLTHH